MDTNTLYYYMLFWFYPYMVVVGMIGIFAARKRSWIWGVMFLTIVTFSAGMEYQEVRENEQILAETLMDSVIAPGETEEYDVEDDLWVGEEIVKEHGISFEIVRETDVHEI